MWFPGLHLLFSCTPTIAMLPWGTSLCFPAPQPFVPCPTTIDVLGPTIHSLWPQPQNSFFKTISVLCPNSWHPLCRPLMAWPTAIDSLDTSHLFLVPQILNSFYRHIAFLWTQPVVSRPPLYAVLDFLHLIPMLQQWISRTPTFPFVAQNPALPGYQPSSSRPPHPRLSAAPPHTPLRCNPHTT